MLSSARAPRPRQPGTGLCANRPGTAIVSPDGRCGGYGSHRAQRAARTARSPRNGRLEARPRIAGPNVVQLTPLISDVLPLSRGRRALASGAQGRAEIPAGTRHDETRADESCAGMSPLCRLLRCADEAGARAHPGCPSPLCLFSRLTAISPAHLAGTPQPSVETGCPAIACASSARAPAFRPSAAPRNDLCPRGHRHYARSEIRIRRMAIGRHNARPHRHPRGAWWPVRPGAARMEEFAAELGDS